MKITSYATSILAFSLLIGGSSSMLGSSGCAATSKSTDLFDGDAGDDGGVSHSDSGKHDGATGGDSGGGGADSGGGGGDCAAFCAKEAAVTGCPTEAACNTTCQTNSAKVPAACQSDWSAVLTCAVSPGMIASCSGTQAMISGCTTQINALTACLQANAGDGGMMMGTSHCGQIITCLNACGATDQACVNACFAAGTTTGKNLVNALETCLFGPMGTTGACGSVCGSQTTACTNCLQMAQSAGGACYSQVQACSADM